MFSINIYNTITDINKDDWDLLTPDNLFMCYEYLKTFEETTEYPLKPYYITAANGGRIIGASVCYFEKNSTGRGINNVFLGRLRRYKWSKIISFLPSVICNRQRGHGTHFIFLPGLSKEEIILLQNKILDEIEDAAVKNKSSVCFLNITEEEEDLIKILQERGYINTIDLPSNFIDIKWTSFEEYKKYISRKYPYMNKSIRHQLNKNKKSGVVIKRLHNIDCHHERLLELLKMNHYKYSSTIFPMKPDYFQRVRENFGNNAVIYAAVKDETIIGVSVELRKGKETYFSSIGVDHNLSKNDLTYFNLAYYEPIKVATECGIKRIYYGIGLYRTKIKRGCSIKNMFVYYKPASKLTFSAVKLWFAFHKQWMKGKLEYIRKL